MHFLRILSKKHAKIVVYSDVFQFSFSLTFTKNQDYNNNESNLFLLSNKTLHKLDKKYQHLRKYFLPLVAPCG